MTQTTASLCSIPERVKSLEHVVRSIRPQVDRLNVYLNDWPEVPRFLEDHGCTVVRSQDSERGDMKGAGKLYWTQDASLGFHLCLDDDIAYPPDYVRHLTSALTRYTSDLVDPAIVGIFGGRYIDYPEGAYSGRAHTYQLQDEVSCTHRVHQLGAGTLCFHASDAQARDILNPAHFLGWGDDERIAVRAKQRNVPLYVVARDLNYLRSLPESTLRSTYETTRRDPTRTAILDAMIWEAAPWPPYPLRGITLQEDIPTRRYHPRPVFKR
jgi:hypothetical protein